MLFTPEIFTAASELKTLACECVKGVNNVFTDQFVFVELSESWITLDKLYGVNFLRSFYAKTTLLITQLVAPCFSTAS